MSVGQNKRTAVEHWRDGVSPELRRVVERIMRRERGYLTGEAKADVSPDVRRIAALEAKAVSAAIAVLREVLRG